MQYAQLKNIPNVTIDDIYTGNGVSELINLSMSALLDTGDEVLVPSPDYPLWTACVNLAGGTAVHYLCDEQSEWYPDIDDIRSKITSNTKAIVIINRTTPPAHFTQRKCSSRSSTSRANTSSSSSPTKSTIASSWTACSTSPSPRWPRTCSA